MRASQKPKPCNGRFSGGPTREKHDTDPATFIAARAECGAYLGLGYRLMRLREKFQVADI